MAQLTHRDYIYIYINTLEYTEFLEGLIFDRPWKLDTPLLWTLDITNNPKYLSVAQVSFF